MTMIDLDALIAAHDELLAAGVLLNARDVGPALAAYERRLWQPIATAPADGTFVFVYAAARDGLPAFVTWASYHPDAGWCVDELREVTHWRPFPVIGPDGKAV